MKRSVSFMLLSLVLFASSLVDAIPSLETYGRLEQVSNVAISPSGEMIAYRRTESDEKDILVVYSLKDNKQVTAVSLKEIKPRGHYFLNDKYLILKGAWHVDWMFYRDDFDIGTSFSLNIKTGKVEQLIVPGEPINKKTSFLRGQRVGAVLGHTPDGKYLYMPAFTKVGFYDAPKYALLKIGVDGRRARIIHKGSANTRKYFLDDEGNILARESLDEVSNVHSIERYTGNKWETIYSYKAKIKNHSFIALTNDFSSIVFSQSDDDEGYKMLSLKDGEVKPFEDLVLEKNARRLLRDNDDKIVGVMYAGFSPSYRFLDKKLDKRVQDIMALFKGHSVYLSNWTEGYEHIVVRVEGDLYAGRYFLFSKGKEPKALASARLDFDDKDINPVVETEFKARDGLVIPTLLTVPKAKLASLENLPAVVLPHGGPASHDRVGFNYKAQALASRGYLVIQPQFRGSRGFGRDFLEAGWGEWGKGMQNDLTDAVKTYVEEGLIDPERICIVGASYGGYAALAGVAFTPELYKCAVSVNGVSHLPKMLSDEKKDHGKDSWVLDYWNRSIAEGASTKQRLKEVSPYFAADKIKAPVLLLHGENDTVVEFEQSRLMEKALKKTGGDVRLVKLKDDDHYLSSSTTRIQALKELVGFVESHIGG